MFEIIVLILGIIFLYNLISIPARIGEIRDYVERIYNLECEIRRLNEKSSKNNKG